MFGSLNNVLLIGYTLYAGSRVLLAFIGINRLNAKCTFSNSFIIGKKEMDTNPPKDQRKS